MLATGKEILTERRVWIAQHEHEIQAACEGEEQHQELLRWVSQILGRES